MRNFDMPWLGGASGSIVDRLLSAIALSFYSAKVYSSQPEEVTYRSRAYFRNTVTASLQLYVIRDLGGLAIVEMVGLIGGGHHSLGELLLGVHSVVRTLEAIMSDLDIMQAGRTGTE